MTCKKKKCFGEHEDISCVGVRACVLVQDFEIVLHVRHRLQSRDKQSIETPFFKALAAPSANCVSPRRLICDRLLETDRALLGLWIPLPCTLTSSLSGGWSLSKMANGARDIIQQIPGLESQSPIPPMLHAGNAHLSETTLFCTGRN